MSGFSVVFVNIVRKKVQKCRTTRLLLLAAKLLKGMHWKKGAKEDPKGMTEEKHRGRGNKTESVMNEWGYMYIRENTRAH